MTTHPHSTIVGIFRDRSLAEQAMDTLGNAGFDQNSIRYLGAGDSAGGFLKSLFTGQGATSDNVGNELTNMGVANEEAQYYAGEYSNGRSIVAVQAPGREQEAMDILQRHGAYNDYSARSAAAGAPTPMQQGSPPSAFATPPMQQRTSPPPPPPAPVQVGGHPVQPGQQPGGDLQSLQTQLQTTQRQLQDAQAQLQAAKEREAQLRATKEHDMQLQATQKQLQDAQAQLQATMAELQATQARLGEANR